MSKPSAVLDAPFALRVVQRKGGRAAIVYRRRADARGRDRLQRVATLSPLAFTAAVPLLRQAVRESRKDEVGKKPAPRNEGKPVPGNESLAPGPWLPLDAAWGARVACFALVAAGLRDGERLARAAEHLRHAEPDQAAWWLGLLTQERSARALRALRILTEAVA